MALAAALIGGTTSLFSAAAGGVVGILSGAAAALMASLGSRKSAGAALLGALRAEALRIGLAFALAWLVLANYPGVAVAAFLATLVVTMLIFSMAFFVRDY
jgi:ATP synthase protein I